eukprot:2258682-Pleurochrysis_carterae.AAC.1
MDRQLRVRKRLRMLAQSHTCSRSRGLGIDACTSVRKKKPPRVTPSTFLKKPMFLRGVRFRGRLCTVALTLVERVPALSTYSTHGNTYTRFHVPGLRVDTRADQRARSCVHRPMSLQTSETAYADEFAVLRARIPSRTRAHPRARARTLAHARATSPVVASHRCVWEFAGDQAVHHAREEDGLHRGARLHHGDVPGGQGHRL